MSKRLVDALCERLRYTGEVSVIETHVSWVLLSPERVWKIKKPVDLGFLDFSTLRKRHFYCDEEVRLNRRTAPGIYLGVSPISGTEDAPRLDDASAPIEYAVVMRRFDDSRQFDRLIAAHRLDEHHVARLARAVADFHAGIAGAGVPEHLGTAAAVSGAALANFDAMSALVDDPADATLLCTLQAWTSLETDRLHDAFEARRDRGFVRECHGDLHLANIFDDGRHAVPFDCLEFNPSLRWIDTMADIAFTIMDLANSGEHKLADLLLNEYLTHTGDYGGLLVLRYYLVYRALVRAKVAAIRGSQVGGSHRIERNECRHYLQLADHLSEARPCGIVLMCGFSGTGKTTVARQLAADLDAVHVRSDVERKRLFGLGPLASSHEAGLDIYTEAATGRTFSATAEAAARCLDAGYPVIVDATFTRQRLRRKFQLLAQRYAVPFVVVETIAREGTVRERLEARYNDASEARFDEYLGQRAAFEAPTADESATWIRVDTEAATGNTADRVRTLLGRDTDAAPASSRVLPGSGP